MLAPEKYTAQTLLWKRRWTPQLFSFRLSRPESFKFKAGQFARLGLPATDADPDSEIWRPYSVVSGEEALELEFFSVIVPGGQFTERLSAQPEGSQVLLEKSPYGFLTTERFAPGRALWMISTGTGLAPFISILYDRNLWTQYQQLIVVHSVRTIGELGYQDEIQALAQEGLREGRGARLHYVPIVTREKPEGMLHERIPTLIDSGVLERLVDCVLEPSGSRALLCGNPEMVSTVRQQLSARGFVPPRRGQLGTLTVENYW
jgi:ferredoxin--NADP+ reductase